MKQRLQRLITHLQQGLIERETPVRLALLAALAGEHLLLLGPPGTAKSELARRLQGVFADGAYFERLLTRFSVPEELFGPLSIKALEEDRYQRLTDHYLPTATIAFIDEIFKANSAILNTLLTLLNEREFDNGASRERTPLIAVIGASNELPEGEELDALYDRFLLRYQVDGVSDEGFDALLDLSGEAQPLAAGLALSREELAGLQLAAAELPLDPAVRHLLKGLREYLQQQGRYVSDRRWRKLVQLLRVAALTNGEPSVSVWDCWLLQHCLWDRPEQRLDLLGWYESHLGTDAVLNPERLERLVRTWEGTLEQERHATRHLKNADGELLYLDHQGRETTDASRRVQAERDGEPLYLAPPDQDDRDNGGSGYTRDELRQQFFDDHYQQCHIDGDWVTLDDYVRRSRNRFSREEAYRPKSEPIRYSERHIQDRVDEIGQLEQAVADYQDGLQEKLLHLDESVRENLWLEPAFTGPARRNLEQSLQVARDLGQRIGRVIDGYRSLGAGSAMATDAVNHTFSS